MVAIHEDADLTQFNTYRLPGRSAFLAVVESDQELLEAYGFARSARIPVAVLGGGSNVIVDERGFDGLVVVNRIRLLTSLPGNRLEIGAGLDLEEVLRYMQGAGLGGIERLAGIPGTVGGAIYGNAGAFGVQIGDVLEEVLYLAADGNLTTATRANCRFSYRNSAFKRRELPGIIVSSILQLEKRDPAQIAANIEETLAAREGKHPAGASCGSYFKNIEGDKVDPALRSRLSDWIVFGRLPAGKLIQEAGGKGLRVGGAYVSDRHGNFLMNDGTATAADIRALAALLKARVCERFGIELEEEVQYL